MLYKGAFDGEEQLAVLLFLSVASFSRDCAVVCQWSWCTRSAHRSSRAADRIVIHVGAVIVPSEAGSGSHFGSVSLTQAQSVRRMIPPPPAPLLMCNNDPRRGFVTSSCHRSWWHRHLYVCMLYSMDPHEIWYGRHTAGRRIQSRYFKFPAGGNMTETDAEILEPERWSSAVAPLPKVRGGFQPVKPPVTGHVRYLTDDVAVRVVTYHWSC
jgi:hypothetical protein